MCLVDVVLEERREEIVYGPVYSKSFSDLHHAYLHNKNAMSDVEMKEYLKRVGEWKEKSQKKNGRM